MSKLPKRILLEMKAHPAFFQRVWKACAAIPAGETRSYGWLARRVGRPGAARAVGTALASNPFAPRVPCHRVLRSDGGLGGYSGPGGLKLKQRLLVKEAGARRGARATPLRSAPGADVLGLGLAPLRPPLAAAAFLAAGVAAALALTACGAKNKNLLLSPEYGQKTPKRVAVLPFENETLDLTAPGMLRKMARDRAALRGFPGPTLAEVDAGLRTLGISDGGQLRAIKPQDLAGVLGTDGLLYGKVEEFASSDAGFGMKKAVRVSLSLVVAADGSKIWEDAEEETQLDIRGSKEEAGREFLGSMAEKALGNMRERPLEKESKAVMDKLFRTLPYRSRK